MRWERTNVEAVERENGGVGRARLRQRVRQRPSETNTQGDALASAGPETEPGLLDPRKTGRRMHSSADASHLGPATDAETWTRDDARAGRVFNWGRPSLIPVGPAAGNVRKNHGAAFRGSPGGASSSSGVACGFGPESLNTACDVNRARVTLSTSLK